MRQVRGLGSSLTLAVKNRACARGVKKNACGIWVKNALRARGEEFLPLAGMEREELQAYGACVRFRKLAGARGEEPGMRPVVKKMPAAFG